MSEENYNKQSADLRPVPNPLPVDHKTQPGDFSWNEDFTVIYVCLPCDKHMDAIHVQRGGPGGSRVWGWDGNKDKPTLTPSIHYLGHWHGYLNAGRLQSLA